MPIESTLSPRVFRPTGETRIRLRGAALVETSIVLVYLLGLLFGGFQLGLAGYYQLAMDNAAQTQARLIGLSSPPGGVNANAELVNAIPRLKNISMPGVTQNMPGPIDTDGIDYDTGNVTSGTSGYYMTIPVPDVSVMQANSGLLRLGNIPIGISSTAVEATFLNICPESCRTPNVGDATIAANSSPYFSQSLDTAPFFGYEADMPTCYADPAADLTTPQQWNSCTAVYAGTIWEPSASPWNWRYLGLAPRLDSATDIYRGPGMWLDPAYSGLQGAPPAATQAGPFAALWCHRNIFAMINQNFDTPYPMSNAAEKAFLTSWLGGEGTGNPAPGAIIYNAMPNSNVNAGWDSFPRNPVGQTSIWYGCGTIH